MFQVRFDFDLQEYKRRLDHFKRTKTKPTYFQGPGQARLREA